jgi:ATP-binding cassette subfamily B protein
VQQVAAGLSLGAVLWRYGPAIPFLPAVGGILAFVAQARFAAQIYAFDYERTPARRERDALAGTLTDRVAAKEVRLYRAAPALVARWRDLALALMRERREIEAPRLRWHVAIDVVRGLLYGAALLVLLLSVVRGGMSLGAYVAAAGALMQLAEAWQEIAFRFGDAEEAMRYLQRDLYTFLPPDVADSPADEPSGVAPPAGATIELDHVSFTYPGQERAALCDVTLTIPAGQQRVGLVGPNGAGKSTLARVLLGLYPVTAGVVRVGGVALDAADPARREAWWRTCTAVFQDFTQYHLTARENVAFGALSAPERVEAAAAAGDAAVFIAGLPDGYETALGPTFGGRDLSGGQWQRLAAARAFMPEVPLVVLDEPTAALDPLAELAVYERFARLTAGRTAVLISHRMASARQCERIIVLDGGRVVEDGTHETLMAAGGLYALLFEAQAQWYR